MHHISKSIYLQFINKSYRFVFSVPKSIRKIYIYMSQCETGVHVNKYLGITYYEWVLKCKFMKIYAFVNK